LEITNDGVGRAYAELIEHASNKELGAFLNKYVSKEAQIITDGWTGYSPLKKDFPKLEQIVSDKGRNFKDLHVKFHNVVS
jgi:hypothetical protein